MKIIRFLLGLSIGAGIALLVAPKSGRELREQLVGGASGKLLTAAPDQYPQPEGERPWGSEFTAVADMAPPVVVEPEAVEKPEADDLKARIDETRAAVEAEIARPFTPVVEEEAVAEEEAPAVVVEEEAPAAVVEEPVVEEPVVEPEPVVVEQEPIVVEQPAAEPSASEAVVEEPVVEEEDLEAIVEAPVAEEEAPAAVAEEKAPVVVEEPVVEEEAPVTEGPEIPREPFVEPFVEPLVEPFAPVVEAVDEAAPVESTHAWDIDYGSREAEAEPVATPEPEPVVAPEPVAEPAPEPEPVAEPEFAPEPEPVAEPEFAPEPELAVAPEAVVEAEPEAPKETAAPEPPSREGGTVDQAEMRRRIEETRARLKAKAFDAMMSGEAALLSRDSGEKPVPTGEDVELDAETDSTIDESLSQEDY